jgi:Pentapeptide repeats (8 copies)
MTTGAQPIRWTEWKAQHRWPRLTGAEWGLEWLVYRCRGLAIFEVLDYLGRLVTVASVVVALIVWVREADDRAKQKHYRAWELINSARGSSGDGGRKDALQDLNEDEVLLVAAPLAKTFLAGVKLPGANLYKADLSGADLTEANLAGAYLTWADLTGADLIGAYLTWADLTLADLTGATLVGATLTGANLAGANLSGAVLSAANVSGSDLAGATLCQTKMPDSSTCNRDCGESEADRSCPFLAGPAPPP